MPAVELGGDADGELQLAHRGVGTGCIGHRADEIATEADENFRRAREHRLDRFDRMMAMLARRFETEHVADAIEIGRSEEHTPELQSLMRISYAVFCLKKKKHKTTPIRLSIYYT